MLTLLTGCLAGDAEALRTAWLVDAVHQDNLVWLSRDPALVEQKYAVMADDPYDFVRGTAGVFLRDLGRAATFRQETAFLAVPEAADVLLVGDPHPENVGTMRPGEGPGPTDAADVLLLEVNDLDGAAFGPYLFDLRRALLGLSTLAAADRCDRACRAEAVGAWVDAWVAALDDPPASGLVDGRGAVLDDLAAEVSAEGAARELLLDVTELLADGTRRIRSIPVDDRGEGMLRPTSEEGAQLARLLDQLALPAGARIHDGARRFGGGVASLPAVRYVVAWDRGDDGPADDELLQLREVVDPPPVPGALDPGSFDSGAHRVRAVHRAVWSRPEADVRFQAATDGVQTFKVTTWSSWNASLDHDKIRRRVAEGRYDDADLRALAAALGAQLGAVHARVPTRGGGEAREAIRADLAGRGDLLRAELVAAAEVDLQHALADHARFVAALDRLGPLLGAEEAPW